MSLTSHLGTAGPLSQFMRQMLPNTKSVISQARSLLAGATSILPDGHTQYTLVGTALDYRLRYYFAVTECESLFAFQGAGALDRDESGKPALAPFLYMEFFDSLTDFLANTSPVRCSLGEEDERLLGRYCLVLAYFEHLARAGLQISTPLRTGRTLQSVEEILAIPDEACVNDMCRLSYAFFNEWKNFIEESESIALNPTFTGSGLVGGADADLIVNGCLWEIKSTIKPELKKEWLYQIVGYALLDFENEHKINELGFYFARQGVLIKWNLSAIVAELSDGQLSLEAARTRFKNVCANLKGLGTK